VICGGCGNKEAVHTIYVCGKGDEKKTGFMFQGKLLSKAKHSNLKKQGRTEYRGDGIDEVRGRDT
jgi:hypothetical protein